MKSIERDQNATPVDHSSEAYLWSIERCGTAILRTTDKHLTNRRHVQTLANVVTSRCLNVQWPDL